MPRIQKMINDEKAFINYLSYKRIEETLRIGSDLSHKSFGEFLLFDKVFNNQKYEIAFEDMQRKYIFKMNIVKNTRCQTGYVGIKREDVST